MGDFFSEDYPWVDWSHFLSPLYSQRVPQCLAHSQCSRNICWINERTNLSYYQLKVSCRGVGTWSKSSWLPPSIQGESPKPSWLGRRQSCRCWVGFSILLFLEEKTVPFPLLAGIVTAWNILLIMRTFPIKCASPAPPTPSIYELITPGSVTINVAKVYCM